MVERAEQLAQVIQFPVQNPETAQRGIEEHRVLALVVGGIEMAPIEARPELTLVPSHEVVSLDFEAAQFNPLLTFSRKQAMRRAEDTLAASREKVINGQFDDVLLPVDPLSTADHYIAVCSEHGPKSEVALEAWQALTLDCQRLLLEAYRAKTWEFFPESKQVFNPETAGFFSHGMHIGALVEKGLSPLAESGELDLRKNDVVEEIGTYEQLGTLLLSDVVIVQEVPEELNVTTLLPCPDWAIDRYKKGGKFFGGYVPEKQKFMIRNNRFDPSTGSRFESQLGMSGEYIDTEIMNEALRILDPRLPLGMDKVQIHATQMIRESKVTVWDYAELLDTLASAKHGLNIFLGEVIDPEQQKDYHRARIEADRRNAALDEQTQELANFNVLLAQLNTDHDAANGIVSDKVRDMMLGVSRSNPELAREMFDDATAKNFYEVLRLEGRGEHEMAQVLLNQIQDTAPSPQFCGAGSCGLKDIRLMMSSKENKELRKELKAEAGDKLLMDTERSCICGSKTIVYAHNPGKVNKFCTTCKKFESTKKTKGTS